MSRFFSPFHTLGKWSGHIYGIANMHVDYTPVASFCVSPGSAFMLHQVAGLG